MRSGPRLPTWLSRQFWRVISPVFQLVMQRPEREWILFTLSLSFLLRFLWICVSPALPVSDSVFYDTAALGIAHGQGYLLNGHPTAYWAVGYPAFLAGIYLTVGHNLFAVQIVQALLGAATIIFVYKIAKLAFSEASGRVASLMLSVSLNNISYTAVLLSEILFTFLYLLTIYCFLQLRNKETSSLHFSAVGVLLALSCYVRPIPLLLPLFLFLFDFLSRENWGQTLRRYTVFVLFMSLTILPWTLRNWIILGSPVIISSNAGIGLFAGNNPNSTGQADPIVMTMSEDLEEKFARVGNDEILREKLAYKEAIGFIKDHPENFLLLALKKFDAFFRIDWDGIYANFRKTSIPMGNQTRYFLYFLCESYYLIVLVLFCSALTKGASWRGEKGLLLGLLFYWLTVHIILFAEPRYRFPVTPIMYMFAASYLVDLIQSCDDEPMVPQTET